MRIHLVDHSPLRFGVTMAHPYRLISYYYLKSVPNPGDFLKSLTGGDDRSLIVDSGLYSFMFGCEQGKLEATYDAYRDYTLRYLEDMAEWGVDCHLVEADTQKILGMDATFRLREEFEPLGSRVMYVWHQPEGLDGLIELAKKVDYLGIGLPELRLIATNGASTSVQTATVDRMCNDLLRRVHTACGDSPPRIHLLGSSTANLMESNLAWSCDSTTWLNGVKFGAGFMWTIEKGLHKIPTRSERYKQWIEMACDLNPEAAAFARATTNPDYYIVCLACAHAYTLYQKWLDSRYTPKPMRGDTLPGGSM